MRTIFIRTRTHDISNIWQVEASMAFYTTLLFQQGRKTATEVVSVNLHSGAALWRQSLAESSEHFTYLSNN